MEQPKRDLLSRFAAFRNPMGYETLPALNPFESEAEFEQAIDELTDRGVLLFDKAQARYDLHPVVRQYPYDRLTEKAGVHARLRDYFAKVPKPDEKKVSSVDDLAPVIELYHHPLRGPGSTARHAICSWIGCTNCFTTVSGPTRHTSSCCGGYSPTVTISRLA